MDFVQKNLKFSIRPAYLRQSIERSEFERFTASLSEMFDRIIADETEENHKNYLRDFLKKSFYADYDINTKGRIDLVIFDGPEAKSSKPAVLIEVKRRKNKDEMLSTDELNRKALHELVHYFLHERLIEGNHSITYLIATDLYQWFVFDARDFERAFVRDPQMKNAYLQWHRGAQSSDRTSEIYSQIADFIDRSQQQMPYTFTDLHDFLQYIEQGKESDELIDLFKFFSPVHLLKLPFANDSNTLDRGFYGELLYILGLEEQQDGTITRAKSQRNEGSLIEETIWQLKRIEPGLSDEQAFEIALELNITWINRILFLKLLENQLVSFNDNDQFYFLSSDKITEFDDLNTLFFSVLALKPEERRTKDRQKYYFIPFLNSSLFEMTDLERKYLRISDLEDKIDLPVYKNTVLKDDQGRQISGKNLPTLKYLLDFLSAYDFGTEGFAKIRSRRKTLINASVLGLIFERINGYRDGSYFTPGAITQFITQKVIEKTILQKFSDYFDRNFDTIQGLANYIKANFYEADDLQRLSDFYDTIRIVDPAVGSGHFLVSALNALVAYKAQLGLLLYKNGERITDYKFSVENDELVIQNHRGELFRYKVRNFRPIENLQRLQEAVFETKRRLIENSLFGVDINPNSVKIARLRLWIELLKNMYYIFDTDFDRVPPMQVLPNIDINIKQGDALISKYDINQKINQLAPGYRQKILQALSQLKEQVALYKATTDRQVKRQARENINRILQQFADTFDPADKDYQKLKLLRSRLADLTTQSRMFSADQKQKSEFDIQAKLIADQIADIEQRLREKYANAFEWRFQFPEVLDSEGNFIGFDIVIGNPPYIQLQKDHGKLAERYKHFGYKTFDRMGDIYALFYERGFQLLRERGWLGYITSNKWMRAGYGKKLRRFLARFQIEYLIDLGPGVFESATVDTNILIAQNTKKYKPTLALTLTKDKDLQALTSDDFTQVEQWDEQPWIIISSVERRIKDKILEAGKPLKDWDINIYYGVKTGFNPAFVIDGKVREQLIAADPRSEEIIKPLLRGRDIKRYRAEFKDKWLINVHSGILKPKREVNKLLKKYDLSAPFEITQNFEIKILLPEAFEVLPVNIYDYPAVKQWLDKFWDKLVKRYDQGLTPYNLRHCAYLLEFEKEKIVWGNLTLRANFGYDRDKGYYIIAPTNFLVSNQFSVKYLLAFLNSKISEHFVKQIAYSREHGYLAFKKIFIEQIPVPEPSDQAELLFERLVDRILAAKDRGEETEELEREIDQMVYRLYGLTSEEIAVVEKS